MSNGIPSPGYAFAQQQYGQRGGLMVGPTGETLMMTSPEGSARGGGGGEFGEMVGQGSANGGYGSVVGLGLGGNDGVSNISFFSRVEIELKESVHPEFELTSFRSSRRPSVSNEGKLLRKSDAFQPWKRTYPLEIV